MKIKNTHLQKLNTKGMAHLLVPLLVIIVVGAVGTYMLVSSHAAVDGGGYAGADAPCYASTYPVAQRKACVKAVAKQESDKRRAASKSKARHADSGVSEIATIPVNPPSNDPPTVASPIISTIAAPAAARPAGNIIITTYVNDPAIDKKGGKDHRLGAVVVKVERAGGSNNCDNRKTQTVKTNSKQSLTRKDGTKVYVKGVVHFLNCDTGSYKVTLIGRKGYTPAGSTTKDFTLNNDETQKVFFVLNKNKK